MGRERCDVCDVFLNHRDRGGFTEVTEKTNGSTDFADGHRWGEAHE